MALRAASAGGSSFAFLGHLNDLPHAGQGRSAAIVLGCERGRCMLSLAAAGVQGRSWRLWQSAQGAPLPTALAVFGEDCPPECCRAHRAVARVSQAGAARPSSRHRQAGLLLGGFWCRGKGGEKRGRVGKRCGKAGREGTSGEDRRRDGKRGEERGKDGKTGEKRRKRGRWGFCWRTELAVERQRRCRPLFPMTATTTAPQSQRTSPGLGAC